MIDLRDLECLLALARWRHFARAAQDCGLSQPAFSARIRNLEEVLGTKIVKRGNRFQQFTPEGDAIIARARGILEDVSALQNEVLAGRGVISGSLVIGTIPTATAKATEAARHLKAVHGTVRTRILTATSLAILQGLEDGRFDVGITYREGVPPDLFEIQDFYEERYVLVAPETFLDDDGAEITWAQSAAFPLTLLEPAMQNRRVLDQIYDTVGVRPNVAFETNGFNAAIILAKRGVAATVVPKALLDAIDFQSGTATRDLVDPVVEKTICMVTTRHGGNLPAAQALRAAIADNMQ
ncbi:MAG: LysR family transcriptional regulator [Pseudomonadota bacterium]